MTKLFGPLLICACFSVAVVGCLDQEPVDNVSTATTGASSVRLPTPAELKAAMTTSTGGGSNVAYDTGCFTSGSWLCCIASPDASWYCINSSCWESCDSNWSHCSGGCDEPALAN